MSTMFEDLKESLGEMDDYLAGKPVAARVHHFQVPDSIDVKAIRLKTSLTQENFAHTFGFSLSTLRKWEGHQRTPEGPARVLLTLIERNPKGVMDILHG